MSRDHQTKAPRNVEPRPSQATGVAKRQHTDVSGDVVARKVRQDESNPPTKAANATTAVPAEWTDSRRTPTTSKDLTRQAEQHQDSDTSASKKQTEVSDQPRKAADSERSGSNAKDEAKTKMQDRKTKVGDETAKRQTQNRPTTQPSKSLPHPRESSTKKPAKSKPKATPAGNSTSEPVVPAESTSALARSLETKVIVTQSKPVSSKPNTTEPRPEQTKSKETAVKCAQVTANRVKGDKFERYPKVDLR